MKTISLINILNEQGDITKETIMVTGSDDRSCLIELEVGDVKVSIDGVELMRAIRNCMSDLR